ncbi:MAG: Glycerol-3-phosphate cytidylyltransferase [Candidatus Nomurabacteria bacterium GW2011_GWE1_32_28]|uniref:Glycerol-3-phosphate cytidylyltransferase n=1 Tax=Candidatus Nomurabacteria bacterium GW2011_GWF1_31_48 TaxID=1618767 RepID=A0A0G0AU59_9BACT|nr:MAG: Glycerol-3-phosphate cytidylyltransferase [Candidatus Nomurabacteria bacterium GW2011_GWF2_30_133]KKP28535.1 MAG: Glycerol-3-phosphate cytidylyltransferase [Candidatus Nomurabacteria bacterium GW2011_GWE2_31_40]KKP30130.1 MAG: Glycerol-3-phosphate cytidylyltransferase [Candidatus Nomurabacteria bacterium GW2011_GWF1_31_48]KKP34675.1 MAG: Glycerol-3-phosphate cytidylyltransferase [Candidatus Nomurabacteria bacterium GW2011_GWE1_32_28]HAS80864.1 cytidyltransferase [Candidatus Nomurabacter
MKKKVFKKKSKKIVAVSGGFDPLHIGHIRYMQEAKKLGDKLVVILNNDNWFDVKGKPVFMSHKERKEIIEALHCVDEVVVSSHKKNTKDISVCKELLKIKPHIFANGGDRKPDDNDLPSSEYEVCERLGIEMVFNIGKGGKIKSSSKLLKEYSNKLKK